MQKFTKCLGLGLVSVVAFSGMLRQAHAETIQLGAPWGLDRIDQDSYTGDGTYHYSATGNGVHVYVLSQGIRSTHVEFGGRVGAGVDFVGDGFGPDGDPNNYYGTHVAGIVGGKTYGAAKNVTLHSVRVDHGSLSVDRLIAGVDWVVANRIQPAVLFVSLTYTYSSNYDAAIQRALDAGITVVTNVGVSSNKDSCGFSPATVSGTISVGAITGLDAVTTYSSLGSCVDLFAPGTQIYSAMPDSDTSIALGSGTGQAAAFVAGAAAIYLEGHPSASPAEVHQAIVSKATLGHIDFSKAYDPTYVSVTPNRILRADVLASALVQPSPTPTASPTPTPSPTATVTPSPTPVANAAPVASFSASCRKAACSFNASSSSDDVGIVSYSWAFGDGATSSGSSATASHTYAAKGTYTMTVSLTVTDGGGLSSTTQKSVTIKNGR